MRTQDHARHTFFTVLAVVIVASCFLPVVIL
jgi:hypothetical protein